MTKFLMIESLLSDLLSAAEASGGLSAVECEEVQSFLDVGEYGLALETAVDIYVEKKKMPSVKVMSLVLRSGEAMLMDVGLIKKRFEGWSSN